MFCYWGKKRKKYLYPKNRFLDLEEEKMKALPTNTKREGPGAHRDFGINMN